MTNQTKMATLLLTIAAAVAIWNMWGLGLAHNDDAIWYLRSFSPGDDIVSDWAASQGRIYAFVAGSMMRFALQWNSTPFGDFLKFAPYAIAIAFYGLAVGSYFGCRIALAAVAVFIGLAAIRWDGSMVLAYPLLAWPSLVACFATVIFIRCYFQDGRNIWIPISFVLTLFGLATNEAVTAAGIFIISAAFAANAMVVLRANQPIPVRRELYIRTWRLGLSIVSATSLYLSVYLWYFLKSAPSYSGTSLTFKNIPGSLDTLFSFSLNGSALYSLFKPYTVVMSYPVLMTTQQVSYDPLDTLDSAWSSYPLAVVFGIICAAALAFTLWISRGAPCAHTPKMSSKRSLRPIATPSVAIAVGAVLAIMAVLPTAFSVKYIDWHVSQGISSYVTTPVSHFGVSLALAGVLVLGLQAAYAIRLEKAYVAIVVCVFALLSAITFRLNSNILDDIRPETLRFSTLDRGIELLRAADMSADTLVLPQFNEGSWFTQLPEEYWAELVKASKGLDISTVYGSVLSPDIFGDAIELTYQLAPGERSVDVMLAHIAEIVTEGAYFDTVALDIGGDDVRARQQVLAYTDLDNGPQQHLVSMLSHVPDTPGSFLLRDVRVIPGTLRLQSSFTGPPLSRKCPARLEVATLVSLATPQTSNRRGACFGLDTLKNGWGAPEPNGVWSSGDDAELLVHSLPSDGPVAAHVQADTLTSLNFAPGQQTVDVYVDGRKVMEWAPAPGTPSPSSFEVPLGLSAADGDGAVIRLEIVSPINLKEEGLGADTRDLGVFLRSLTLVREQEASSIGPR